MLGLRRETSLLCGQWYPLHVVLRVLEPQRMGSPNYLIQLLTFQRGRKLRPKEGTKLVSGQGTQTSDSQCPNSLAFP